jgi:hypothetical protein
MTMRIGQLPPLAAALGQTISYADMVRAVQQLQDLGRERNKLNLEKAELENTLEAEQEFIANRLQMQVCKMLCNLWQTLHISALRQHWQVLVDCDKACPTPVDWVPAATVLDIPVRQCRWSALQPKSAIYRRKRVTCSARWAPCRNSVSGEDEGAGCRYTCRLHAMQVRGIDTLCMLPAAGYRARCGGAPAQPGQVPAGEPDGDGGGAWTVPATTHVPMASQADARTLPTQCQVSIRMSSLV